jgi:Spy/CpxP family protein refolding chaperone
MKNITITLDEETAAWVRVHAAEQNKSVSRLVGEILQSRMRDRREYQRAMRRYLSKPPFDLAGEPVKHPNREDIHDRARIR